MSLVLKSHNELSEELNKRKARFASYRVNYVDNLVVLNNSKDLDTVSYSSDEIESSSNILDSKIFVKNEDDIEVVNVETESKVIDLQKTINTATNAGATKTYNQRMKSGFFGKRRAR